MAAATKSTRVTDAYAQLKEEIRTNRMPPGYQAPEPEIAIRLGMSRTPVREALIRLEAVDNSINAWQLRVAVIRGAGKQTTEGLAQCAWHLFKL